MGSKKNFKSLCLIILAVVFVFAISACQPKPNNGAEPEILRLNYGGATVGGAAYAVSVAHATIWNENIEGLDVTVEASTGGADNAIMTHNNEYQIAHAANIAAYNVFHGVDEYEGQKHENIRGIIPLYSCCLQVVVLDDSPIETVEDLKGKRISVGIKGSGTEIISRNFLKLQGLTYDDIEEYYLAYTETVDGLKDGSLDVGLISTGIPTPAVMELSATHNIRILPVEVDEAQLTDYPFFSPGPVPAGTYEVFDYDIPTIRFYTIGFVHKDLSDDLVYEMTKALWENKDRLAEIHSSQKHLNSDEVQTAMAPIPLHPGAERYYKEQGWVK